LVNFLNAPYVKRICLGLVKMKKKGYTKYHDTRKGKNEYFIVYKGKKLYVTKNKRIR